MTSPSTDAAAASLDSVKQRIATNLKDLGDDERAVERVTPVADLGAAVRDADYVVEAVLEDLPLKQKLFAEIESARPRRTRCSPATPRSFPSRRSCKASSAASARSAPTGGTRLTWCRWWRSSRRQWTDAKVVDFTMKLHAAAGKKPAHVKKDVPGFIGNRLQHALWREAISLVEHGICDAETVDSVIKAAFGRRLAVLGPLENADMVGTDLTLAIHKQVLGDIDSRPGPSPYLERLVKDGKLGFKSGEGFRTWTPEQQTALRMKVLQHLKEARAHDG